jgi:hypothetical protein
MLNAITNTMKKRQEKTLTKQLAQHEIVTLAVYLLGGDQHAVDTEDVAIKAHELAPGRFSWRKYPEQINLELVRVYLSDAKKPEKGQLLLGSGRTGWSLTKTGLDWAQEAAHRSVGKDLTRRREQSKAGSIDENRWRRERARIQLSPAWKHWMGQNQNPSAREAAEVFRIDSYAVGPIREKKITRLLAMFNGDEELAPFLNRMAALLAESEGVT